MRCRQVVLVVDAVEALVGVGGGDGSVCILIPPFSFWTRVIGVALSSLGNF